MRTISKWWNEEVGTAGASLYPDPWLAANAALTPVSLLPGDRQPSMGTPPTAESLGMTQQDFNDRVHVNDDGTWTVQSQAAQQPGGILGFIQNTLTHAAQGWAMLGKAVDKGLSSTPVIGSAYGLAKWVTDKSVIQPLDTMASGAHWLYSNIVSQPLSAAILQMGKPANQWLDPDAISKSYGEAKHISPGQAFMNVLGTQGMDPEVALGMYAANPLTLLTGVAATAAAQDPKYYNENYLYDTDYWRQKEGWKYTYGSGLLDANASLSLDPTVAGGKVFKAYRLATRAVKVEEGMAPGMKFVVKPQTADQLVNSDKFEQFANWGLGKSPEEINLALERGRAARGSAFTSREMGAQLSQVLSQAKTVDDWKLATRFSMGDASAIGELAQKNQSFALAFGKALDNKVNIQNADNIYRKSFNSLVDNNFNAQPIKPVIGRTAAGTAISPAEGRSIAERVKVDEQGRLFVQAPYVSGAISPLAGEAETGVKTAEQLALPGTEQPLVAQTGVGKEFKPVGPGTPYEVKPIDSSSFPTNNYQQAQIPGLQAWKVGIQSSLAANQVQLNTLARDNEWLSTLLGNKIDDVAQLNPLFGSMKEARFAGVGRDVTKQAERRMVQYYGIQADEGFQSRLLQNGVYGATVRFIGKMGDRLPEGMINHNDADAAQRLGAYLKASPINNDDAAELMTNYSRISNKTDALKYIQDVVEPKLFEEFGKKYGMDLETTQEMYNRYRGIYNSEMGTVAHPAQQFSAPISGIGEGEPTRIDRLLDGENIAASPVLATQLQYTSALPNLQKFNRFLAQNSDNINAFRKAGMNVADTMSSFSDSFNSVFKLSQLLRLSYITRNVGEETLSQAAKFGAMAVFANASRGAGAFLRGANPIGKAIIPDLGKAARNIQVNKALPAVQEMGENLDSHIADLEESLSKARMGNTFDGPAVDADPQSLKYLEDRIENAKAYRGEFAQYEQALLQHASEGMKRLGEGTFLYRGQVVPEAFNPEYTAAIPRSQITSENSYKTIFGRVESFGKEDMLRSGNWVTLKPGDANYLNSWERAVNFQILQDQVGRRIVEDPTGESAIKFLKSPEGALYRKNLGAFGGEDPVQHVRNVAAMVKQYIPEEMMEQAQKNGKVSIEDFKNFPIEQAPLVHGEELRQAMNGGKGAFDWFDKLNEKWFQGLPKMASDRLSWQPTYVQAHRVAMQDGIDKYLDTASRLGKPVDFIPMSDMNKLMENADKTARQSMKEILYQPNRTNTSHALRYISPFFNAYTDSMARWGGLIMDNPDLVGKMAKIYNAPIAAHMVTDQNGNVVGEDGRTSDGREVGMDQRVFNLQVNPLTKDLPQTIKDMRVNVGSLNVVTPGQPWWNPGFGPMVAIPADTVMRNFPQSSAFLDWVNPYGTQAESTLGDIAKSISPSWAKDLYDGYDTDGQKYQDALFASYRAQMIDYHNNGGPAPSWKKAEGDARNLFFLNALADGILPGKTRTSDKYQFYVDALQSMRQADPKNANDMFMAKYGNDFKDYADALLFEAQATKSKTGVPSTLEGITQDAKFKDLIEANPELGGFITGDVARSGEFNQWALLNQKASGERTTVSAQDRVKQTAIDAGWDVYSKIMNAIDADKVNRGFMSLQDKGAEDLQALKQKAIFMIANKYPQWADEYTTTDRDAVPKRIAAFSDLVLDPRLANDPMRTDVGVLRTYLTVRGQFQQMLAQRAAGGGSADLSARSNQDLAQAWSKMQEAIAEKDTKFSDLYHRYLSNDNLQTSVLVPSTPKVGKL